MAFSCPSFSQGTSVLLSEDDFKSKFANWCTYGERFHPWPTGTILLFNIRIEHADTGNVEDRWINVINTNKHAEVEMIQILERKMKEPFIRVAPKLRIYLSYSPCSDCAGKLINFKNRLEVEIEIQIRFGTFYKDYCNEEGLLKLLKNGVVLDIFNGEAHWVQFLNDIGIPQGEHERYLRHVRIEKRKDKERVDQDKLDDLYTKMYEKKLKAKQSGLEQDMNSLNIQ